MITQQSLGPYNEDGKNDIYHNLRPYNKDGIKKNTDTNNQESGK